MSKIQQVFEKAYSQACAMKKGTRGEIQPFVKKTVAGQGNFVTLMNKYSEVIKQSSPSGEADILAVTASLFTPTEIEKFENLGVLAQEVEAHKEDLLQMKTIALNAEKRCAAASPENAERLACENASLKEDLRVSDYRVGFLKGVAQRAVTLLEKNGISVKTLLDW